jgi:hypothetical protein
VTYAYPYAQVAYIRWVPGAPVWPRGGLVLVALAACLSLASLLTLGRHFGIRPAWRGLTTTGPYRFVRHPLYLAYLLADIGYNLTEWNPGTVALVIGGWVSLIYRIHAEERILLEMLAARITSPRCAIVSFRACGRRHEAGPTETSRVGSSERSTVSTHALRSTPDSLSGFCLSVTGGCTARGLDAIGP